MGNEFPRGRSRLALVIKHLVFDCPKEAFARRIVGRAAFFSASIERIRIYPLGRSGRAVGDGVRGPNGLRGEPLRGRGGTLRGACRWPSLRPGRPPSPKRSARRRSGRSREGGKPSRRRGRTRRCPSPSSRRARRRRFARARGTLRSLFPIRRKASLLHGPPASANPSVLSKFAARPGLWSGALAWIRFRLLRVETGAFPRARRRKKPPRRASAFGRIGCRRPFPCLQRISADARAFFRASVVSVGTPICVCVSPGLLESPAPGSPPASFRFVFPFPARPIAPLHRHCPSRLHGAAPPQPVAIDAPEVLLIK